MLFLSLSHSSVARARCIVMAGFSGAVKLGDLNDFINPSQSCVVALSGERRARSRTPLPVPSFFVFGFFFFGASTTSRQVSEKKKNRPPIPAFTRAQTPQVKSWTSAPWTLAFRR